MPSLQVPGEPVAHTAPRGLQVEICRYKQSASKVPPQTVTESHGTLRLLTLQHQIVLQPMLQNAFLLLMPSLKIPGEAAAPIAVPPDIAAPISAAAAAADLSPSTTAPAQSASPR